MDALEEIQTLLGQVLAAQQTAHQELSDFRSQQIAHNNATAATMQNIDTRLTVLEVKSRLASPGPSRAEETARKATFAPSPASAKPDKEVAKKHLIIIKVLDSPLLRLPERMTSQLAQAKKTRDTIAETRCIFVLL